MSWEDDWNGELEGDILGGEGQYHEYKWMWGIQSHTHFSSTSKGNHSREGKTGVMYSNPLVTIRAIILKKLQTMARIFWQPVKKRVTVSQDFWQGHSISIPLFSQCNWVICGATNLRNSRLDCCPWRHNALYRDNINDSNYDGIYYHQGVTLSHASTVGGGRPHTWPLSRDQHNSLFCCFFYSWHRFDEIIDLAKKISRFS